MEDNFENIYYCVSNQKIYIFRNNYKILFVLNLKASSLKKKKSSKIIPKKKFEKLVWQWVIWPLELEFLIEEILIKTRNL